ncbi:hypothetical protein B0T24DRAFT_628270 [Lasiosphaeria ovina]|uniref:JmjC domain-containing protein n=1 Tax=Lasiosphaeria ovina TaxID=92902 RepID=A0AAE0N5Q5_9PEZI|nr:hypothetical protein B0T24DRAFT_628270 [Lasiosphaeria ovina]
MLDYVEVIPILIRSVFFIERIRESRDWLTPPPSPALRMVIFWTVCLPSWSQWMDVLEWVLISEGGHNTAPHTDSHGLATWITIQEGHFGFGWLSCPTQKERDEWMANPHSFTGGQWRYVVLTRG